MFDVFLIIMKKLVGELVLLTFSLPFKFEKKKLDVVSIFYDYSFFLVYSWHFMLILLSLFYTHSGIFKNIFVHKNTIQTSFF